jgi:hypothetical protein
LRSCLPSVGSTFPTRAFAVGCSNSDRRSPGLCRGAVLDRVIAGISTKWSSGSPAHMYLWRAVDDEGEVLEILVQRRRDKHAAIRLMRKLLRKQGFAPKQVTTNKLRSYGAAFRHLGFSCHHEPQRRLRRALGNSLPITPELGTS